MSNTPKLIFKLDQKWDTEMAIFMLRSSDGEYRAKRMRISPDFVKRLREARSDTLKKLTSEFFEYSDLMYKINLPYIEKSRKLYQESWNEINDSFFDKVAQLTYPWFFPEYTCVVTHFNVGLRDPKGDRIGRWWKEDPLLQRRLTAYELFQAHYDQIHRVLYKDSGLNNNQIWALAEIASNAITGLEKDLKKFWPWDIKGYYTNHNYPQIVELQNLLYEPYINRKSFGEYIKKGIELVKTYPDISY